MKEEFQAKVSTEGVSVSATGTTVEAVVDAMSSFLSPATEGFGYIGDTIRMYRQENVIRGLARAKKLAEEQGIEIQPVAPKFLVSWVEGVSLESEDTDTPLTDMWAGLLVAASTETTPAHLFYRRFLSEITSDHARFLKYLIKAEQWTPSVENFDKGLHELILLRNRGKIELSQESIENGQVFDDIYANQGPGVLIGSVRIELGSGHIFQRERDLRSTVDDRVDEFEKNLVVAMLLSSEIIRNVMVSLDVDCPNLVEGQETKWDKPRARLVATGYTLTQLGRDFVLACEGRQP